MEDVTYQEWEKATRFARFRYKYGLIVLIACWLALIGLIIFIWIYQHELSENPIIFAVNKLGFDSCTCYDSRAIYYVNETTIHYVENLFS